MAAANHLPSLPGSKVEHRIPSPPTNPLNNHDDSNLPGNNDFSPSTLTDAEKGDALEPEEKVSVYKSLGWLDRFLAIWILLAMIIGVLLGNFVPNVGPALDKGKFVRVSVPIGE